MGRIPALSVALVLLLGAGCAQDPSVDPAVLPSVPPATASAEPGPSSPSPVSPSASPTPTGPSVPGTAGALDVSATVADAGFASFASPSGKIWCALYEEDALCHFPFDYAGKIPNSKKVCPELSELDVTGVAVSADGADYFCSGDPGSLPQVEDSDSAASTRWWPATGWPSVKLDGQKLATLPYGKSLVAGDYVCASARDGVTCANTATGKGFRMARAGVAFID